MCFFRLALLLSPVFIYLSCQTLIKRDKRYELVLSTAFQQSSVFGNVLGQSFIKTVEGILMEFHTSLIIDFHIIKPITMCWARGSMLSFY